MKTYLLFITCPVCGASVNNHCRDPVTNAPMVKFHEARVQAAQE